MRALPVFDFILNELESRQSNCVERQVICSAGVPHRHCRGAEVFERLEPGFEDGDDGRVFLRVNAAQFSGAVIDIEVRGELCMLRLDRQRSGVAAERGRQIALFGRRFRTRREMLRHVCA